MSVADDNLVCDNFRKTFVQNQMTYSVECATDIDAGGGVFIYPRLRAWPIRRALIY